MGVSKGSKGSTSKSTQREKLYWMQSLQRPQLLTQLELCPGGHQDLGK